jgi:hypothetical protein
MDYIAIIHKQPNGDFGVSFPDLWLHPRGSDARRS